MEHTKVLMGGRRVWFYGIEAKLRICERKVALIIGFIRVHNHTQLDEYKNIFIYVDN